MSAKRVNGEHGAIIEEIHKVALQITKLTERQTNNHAENSKKIATLFDKVTKLDGLPCDAHRTDMSNIKAHIAESIAYRRAILVSFVGLLGLVMHAMFQWGRVAETSKQLSTSMVRIKEHIKKDEARWEYYKIPNTKEVK